MHLSMSSRRWGRRGIGRDFDQSLWPGVGHLNYLAVPGVGIFGFLFVPVTTNHFPGGEFQLYLTPHFCQGVGNLTAIFCKMSKSRPMPRLPHRRLDIDRCIILWRDYLRNKAKLEETTTSSGYLEDSRVAWSGWNRRKTRIKITLQFKIKRGVKRSVRTQVGHESL